MQNARTWRELLGKIITNPQERQRIADELGIHTITLTRWVNSQSDPRPHNLRRLVNAVPEYRDSLLALIGEELEDFPGEAMKELPGEIPSAFYARVLNSNAFTPYNLRYWSICNLILQQALRQLDPERLGMAVIIVQCMPPFSGQKIRSLRESVGMGTHPWRGDLTQQGMLLGAESLAGYAITSDRPVVIQNLREDQGLFPAQPVQFEESAAAYPIMRAGRLAGCLLVSSTQANYFVPSRLTLIQAYADLLVLAFETEEFYEPQSIELRVMPPQDIQKTYFSNFRQRLAKVMQEAIIRHEALDTVRAEQLVWHQLEEELLQLLLNPKQ
jgi:GAF domain